MSKLLSKISITSIAIAAIVGGTMYLTTNPEQNKTLSHNSAVAQDVNAVALASVWDQETEPDYSGTLEMTVYRSPSCVCCGVWIEHAKKHGGEIATMQCMCHTNHRGGQTYRPDYRPVGSMRNIIVVLFLCFCAH